MESEDDGTHQDAADGRVDLPDNVADDVQSCDQTQLHRVVYHHTDEHYVPRVLVEKTGDHRKGDGHSRKNTPCDRDPL